MRTVRIEYKYDEALVNQPPPWIINRTKEQKEEAARKAKIAGKKVAEKRRKEAFPAKDTRTSAEHRMIERVKQAVQILSFGLSEMTGASVPSGNESIVYQSKIIDAIRYLCKSMRPELPIPEVVTARKSVATLVRCHRCFGLVCASLREDGEVWCDACWE